MDKRSPAEVRTEPSACGTQKTEILKERSLDTEMLLTALHSVPMVTHLSVGAGTGRFGYGTQKTEILKERSADIPMVSHRLRSVPMGKLLPVQVGTEPFACGTQTTENS